MTKSRFGSYTSYFSEQLSKTTASVSQLVSPESRASMKNSIVQQYDKCQSNLNQIAASGAVTQIKDNMNLCKNVAIKGYEKAKVSVNEAMLSETVQGLATSLKENVTHYQSVAKVGCDKVKATATQVIGQEKMEKINLKCDEYKESLSENYNFAKTKLNEWVESEEVLRAKSIFDGSVNAILSTNLMIDLGLMFVPGASSFYVTLQCSKYLIASIIFIISACKSYDTRKQDHDMHEKILPYEIDIDKAYEITSQLQKLFLSVEDLLQTLSQPKGSAYITSKDFEIPVNANSEKKDDDSSNFTNRIFVRSFLEGVSKSAWIHYMLQMSLLCLPATGTVNICRSLLIAATLAFTALSALRRNKLHVDNEAKLDLLEKKLEPIYSTLRNLENKLSSNTQHNLSNIDNEIKTSTHDESHTSSPILDIKSFTEGVAKASGLYLLLQAVSSESIDINCSISIMAMLFTLYDCYINNQKQVDLKESFKHFEVKMQETKEMTEKLKKLVVKQGNYEKHLSERNQHRSESKEIVSKLPFFQSEKPTLLVSKNEVSTSCMSSSASIRI